MWNLERRARATLGKRYGQTRLAAIHAPHNNAFGSVFCTRLLL